MTTINVLINRRGMMTPYTLKNGIVTGLNGATTGQPLDFFLSRGMTTATVDAGSLCTCNNPECPTECPVHPAN